jgi:ferric-dicitrate binding protein FerR (iron transport regulator)
MKYTDFEMEDFILDKSFQNYCLEKTPEDVAFWQNWITEHPEKSETIRQAREIYIALNGNHTAAQFVADRNAFAMIAEKHLSMAIPDTAGSYLQPAKSTLVRRLVWYSSIAAAVIIITFFVSNIGTWSKAEKDQLTYNVTEKSREGERRSFRLPDGSKVMLNAGSTMQIDENFNTKTRELSLEGEAFFDVAHDASRPFIIHTHKMDIKVLGTIFNVRAYPGDKTTETSLIKGSVEITLREKATRKVLLRPNEKIVLPNLTDPANTKNAATTGNNEQDFKITGLTYNKNDYVVTEVSWTQNRLAFSNCSFETIAKDLERWYNVSIRFTNEEVKQYRFTATFDQKNIEQVLTALQLSRYFKYTITGGNNIIISKQ